MMSPRKTPLALITVGPLIFGAPLGEEVATGQVKPEHFEKMREALASQREALASPHDARSNSKEIQELKSLLCKQMERQRNLLIQPASWRPAQTWPFRLPPCGSRSSPAAVVNLGVKFTKTMLIAQGSYGSTILYIGAIFPDAVVRPNPNDQPHDRSALDI